MDHPTAASPHEVELEIYLLSSFRIVIDGAPVAERVWTRRKAKTLVKLLALSPRHQLHREQLLELLWPEQEPEAALNNLHKTIHAARRALEPDLKSGADSRFIITQDQHIALRAPGGLWLDVEEFERQANAALKTNDPARAEAALELYAGELLGEDIYEDWAAARREQLRLLYQQLLNHLARLHAARGEPQQSIERFQQLLTANPSNEEAHRHLMQLYAASGSRHQALQQYQLCCAALRRELDAEPERATVALYQQIIAGQSPTLSRAGERDSQPSAIATEISTNNSGATISAPSATETLPAVQARRRVAILGALAALLMLTSVGFWFYTRARRAPEISSLVVLPFANESADQGLEYLSDGITESIINNLTQLDALRVLARTTAFRYKNRVNDPQSAGNELKVEAVLTGKLQRRGDTLIVQAELVRTSDGAQLWGEQYNLKTTDAFTIQQRISREITEKLRKRLTQAQEQRLADNQSVNPDAYRHYLRGRYHWNRRTVAEIKKSIEHFQQALALEPNYALAYAGLADAYSGLSNTHLPPREAVPLVRAAALKALELDDRLAEAHTALAYIKWRYEWDWPGGEAEFNRALELNPNYPTARQWHGLALLYQKKFQAGRAELLKAQELDPLSLAINASVGLSYYFARQYEPAGEQLRRTRELDQNFAYAHFFLGWVLEQQKDLAQAIASFQRAIQIDDTPITRTYLAHAYAITGQRAAAEKTLEELQKRSASSYVSPYYLAVICAGLGENDRALDYLERGVEDHSDSMVLLGVEPKFDALRSAARFGAILKQVGLNP